MNESKRNMFRLSCLIGIGLVASSALAEDQSWYMEMYRDWPIGSYDCSAYTGRRTRSHPHVGVGEYEALGVQQSPASDAAPTRTDGAGFPQGLRPCEETVSMPLDQAPMTQSIPPPPSAPRLNCPRQRLAKRRPPVETETPARSTRTLQNPTARQGS